MRYKVKLTKKKGQTVEIIVSNKKKAEILADRAFLNPDFKTLKIIKL